MKNEKNEGNKKYCILQEASVLAILEIASGNN